MQAVQNRPQPDLIDELPVAYVEVDAQCMVTRANRAARDLLSAQGGELVGKPAWELMPFDEQGQGRAAFFQCLELDEEPPVVRRSIYTSRGGFRVCELHRSLIRDEHGHPAGMRYVSIDVNEAQIAHEEAHKSRQWLESVLASVPEAMIVTDALGFVRYVNPAVEELFGWKAEELIGKVVEKWMPLLSYSSSTGDNNPPGHRKTLEQRCKGVATTLNRERKEICMEIGTSPIWDKENGYTIGVVYVMRKVEGAA
jgi:PAS domain S-box-containing protein